MLLPSSWCIDLSVHSEASSSPSFLPSALPAAANSCSIMFGSELWICVFLSRICCISHIFSLLTWHGPSRHPFTLFTQPPVQLYSCGRISLYFASVTVQCILSVFSVFTPHFTCPLLQRWLPVAPDCPPLKTAQPSISLSMTLRDPCENFSG